MFNFMRLPPLRRLMLMKAITGGGSWSTITGNPVSFTAKAAPLRQLSVAFSPVQEGSGDPSPDNVRPISGWDSLTVYHSGADTSDPQTISISLGSTVYSGYVDVVTGVVTVDHTKWSAAGATSYSGGAGEYGYGKRYNNLPKGVAAVSSGTGIPAITSVGATQRGYYYFASISRMESGTVYDYAFAFGNNSDQILIYIKGATEETFDTLVSDFEVCYELAEPLTIQLTPQEVESLAGDNTMWTDGDSLEVTYRSN